MTLKYFSKLPRHQQHKQLLSDGVFVADRKAEDTESLLFRLNNFFVEVCFPCEGDDVLYTRHYDGAAKLAPYWQQVQVAGRA